MKRTTRLFSRSILHGTALPAALATLAALAALATACTSSGISKSKSTKLHREVQNHGLIIGFEGLQPFSGHRADDLTKRVAKDLDLAQAATSGNSAAHMPLIVEANANHQPIYIVGYSLGGNEARSLAEQCRKAGISINMLFLLDPGAMGVFTSKIPDNVRKVVFYASGTYDGVLSENNPAGFLEDPSKTLVEFQDVPNLNHLNLPSHVTKRIEDAIAADLGRSAWR